MKRLNRKMTSITPADIREYIDSRQKETTVARKAFTFTARDGTPAKNAKLRAERGIGFEDIVFHIERGDLLDILEHPESRPLRLKTIMPSRKATNQYLGEESDDEA